MLKRLLLSGTALVALTTVALAQATPSGPAPSGSTMSAPTTTGMTQSQSKNEPLFTNYKGADVLGSDGKSIGSLADVVIGPDGQVQQLVISHGGVIGIGSTLNAYDAQTLPELMDGKVKLGLTTASLDQLPKFEYPSASGTAPAEGRASTTAGTPMSGPSPTATAPRTDGSPSMGTATNPPPAATPADRTAMNKAADNAASTAASTAATGSMWPVSYIVGADIKKGDKAASITDARFEGGKLSAVLIDDGSAVGLGKGKQQVAFNQLAISGTPKSPVITLSDVGTTSAPAATAPAPSAPSSSAPAASPNSPASNPSGDRMGH